MMYRWLQWRNGHIVGCVDNIMLVSYIFSRPVWANRLE